MKINGMKIKVMDPLEQVIGIMDGINDLNQYDHRISDILHIYDDEISKSNINNNKICKKHSHIPEYRIGETETKFNIEVICPGLNRKNLSLTEENRTLKIEYKRTDDSNLYNPDSFTINHRIPHDSDVNNISSEYVDGILKINIPKIKKNPNRIDVK